MPAGRCCLPTVSVQRIVHGRISCLRLILRTFGVSRTRLQLSQIGRIRERVPRKVSAIQRAALEARSAMRVSFGARKLRGLLR